MHLEYYWFQQLLILHLRLIVYQELDLHHFHHLYLALDLLGEYCLNLQPFQMRVHLRLHHPILHPDLLYYLRLLHLHQQKKYINHLKWILAALDQEKGMQLRLLLPLQLDNLVLKLLLPLQGLLLLGKPYNILKRFLEIL
jgi:hypothetical protein